MNVPVRSARIHLLVNLGKDFGILEEIVLLQR
jgi:hypothetical protein